MSTGLWLFTLALALVASSPAGGQSALSATQAQRPVVEALPPFASSDSCRACHPGEYASWRASYHSTMTQLASAQTVLGDFSGSEVVVKGARLRLFERDGHPWAEIEDPTWDDPTRPAARVERPVVMTTGSHHHQLYWVPTGQARSLTQLPLAHDIASGRWFPAESNFIMPPELAHAERPYEIGTWNRGCIHCHSTGGEPRVHEGMEKADTRAAELGIACESCHGAAADHVAAERDPLRRYDEHLAERRLAMVTNPSRLSQERSAEVCGRCHSVWRFRRQSDQIEFLEHGSPYRAGDSLDDAGIRVVPAHKAPEPGAFWSDGMLRATGIEYNGLIESPCYQRGPLDCLSCHSMHKQAGDERSLEGWRNGQLAIGMDGDAACLQCHGEFAADPAAHTHHEAQSGGSRCLNCHMPHTSLGLRKAIRSHQVASPSALSDLETGRINACSTCHLDRSLGWAAAHMSEWYGHPSPELDPIDSEVAVAVVDALRGNAAQRALVAWHLGWQPALEATQGAPWAPFLLAQLLDDPYDALRYIAQRSLRAHPGYATFEFDFVAPYLERTRRVGVALRRWRRQGGDPESLRSLLGDAEQQLGSGVMVRLRQNRDHTAIQIRE